MAHFIQIPIESSDSVFNFLFSNLTNGCGNKSYKYSNLIGQLLVN